jgi:hypothetical protein
LLQLMFENTAADVRQLHTAPIIERSSFPTAGVQRAVHVQQAAKSGKAAAVGSAA